MSNSRCFSVQLEGKELNVKVSKRADRVLQELATPLQVEMELYFSCMIRKRVRFPESVAGADFSVKVDNLDIGFRPIMTESCNVRDFEDAPPTTDFPIVRPGAFIPEWLSIDFRKGEWIGAFGYTR